MYGQNGFLPIDYIFSTWPVEHIENTDNISTTELLCRRIDKLKQHLVDVGDARSKLKQSRLVNKRYFTERILQKFGRTISRKATWCTFMILLVVKAEDFVRAGRAHTAYSKRKPMAHMDLRKLMARSSKGPSLAID
ncbi:hypothetical protein V1520DRAFT_342768 [Lipomyces starkeyi]